MRGTMWRKRTSLFLILTIAGILSAPGCASITRRSTQRIPVTSSPPGASVAVNGIQKGQTPLVIRLPRRQERQIIRIESLGYNPVEIRMKRRGSGQYFFYNAFFYLVPGALPLIFDIHTEAKDFLPWSLIGLGTGLFLTTLFDFGITGAIHEFRPEEISVTLTKADGSPRVDTIVLDADDFRNIKWIRVHRD
jgi:hypothetical protein